VPDALDKQTADLRSTAGVLSWLVPPDFYPERVVDNQTWAEGIFEPVALIGVVVCFVIGVVQLGLAVAPDWAAGPLAPLSVLVCIEAFVYSRRLARGTTMLKEWLVLLAPVVVLVRLLSYIGDPRASLLTDVAGWIKDPASLFSLAFVVDCLVLFVAWLTTFWCTQFLNQLRVQPGEIANASTGLRRELFEDSARVLDHAAPLRQLGQIFVTGGVLLVLFAGLASIGTSQFLSIEAIGEIVGFQRPSLHLVQVNVVAYFVFGLALLGECHFVRQRTLWRLDRVAMPAEVTNRWMTGLVGLIVAALIVAFALPTSYAMTLGDIISAVTVFVARVTIFVASIIFYLIYLVASLIPFFKGTDSSGAPAQPIRPPPVPSEPAGASPLDVLRSIVFWAIVFGIVGYSSYVGWRRRPSWLALPPIDRLGGWLVGLVLGLFQLGRRAGQGFFSALATLPRLLRPPAPLVVPRRRFISLSRLGPAELLEYFYLSVCERASQLGHPREAGTTPAEYQRNLQAELPVVDPELATLTDAFIEARYGPRATTRADVERLRPGWQTLKRKLREARFRRRPG
jgi:hypothetical protein